MKKGKNSYKPETIASIAAQFVVAGDEQEEALRKATALYVAACAYIKRLELLSPDEQAFELDSYEALRQGIEREKLAIGDSEAKSPALLRFRELAETKTEKSITHKAFVNLITKEFHQLPEGITPSELAALHDRLRIKRSQARFARRRKVGK